ncbi:hypothetical protein BpHYR1_003555 [Brachionus plicatilis]|uniref:Uncharacterized protein n=1 Tax=Brachionus plicatilis TaxID=10195 RepID=A0A3M7QED1_BRAPC|nr:hypothetical protein BpHYR1_003555 [Brachionus plicatilis]
MATNEFNVLLNVSESAWFMICTRSNSNGFRMRADFWMDWRKVSICIRSRPMPVHWVPMPEKTYQTGLFSLCSWLNSLIWLFPFRMVNARKACVDWSDKGSRIQLSAKSSDCSTKSKISFKPCSVRELNWNSLTFLLTSFT